MNENRTIHFATLTIGLLAAGCGGTEEHEHPAPAGLAHTLFVAHEGSLVSYDIATGEERPGAVQNVTGPVDLQALDDGTLLVNLTGRDEILAVDGATMLEKARIPSSGAGATRPVHSYISPERGGKRYWFTLNDGEDGKPSTNSARLLDVTPGSATYLTAVGEVALGVGHHKASFSATTERVVISNIGDCDDVLTVYDYANPADIKPLATLSAKDAGYDGSSPATTCDPTYAMGAPPAPHGCATAKGSGKAYCNLTSSGAIVAIAIDATPPTFTLIPTGGSGSGYTKAHPGGQYIYSLQESPREGSTEHAGASCQIGQLVVIDAMTDKVVKELPLSYKGPGCKDAITGTDEATAEPAHIQITPDGKTLYITTAGGFGLADARVRQELVLDITNPADPVQRASAPVGPSIGHHGDALSGDGKLLFIADNEGGTVTQIDAATGAVVRTLTVEAQPKALATFGDAEGPSAQTGPIH